MHSFISYTAKKLAGRMQALFPVALSRNVIYNNTLLPSCRKTFLLKLASLPHGLESLKYRVQLNQLEQCCACCTECTSLLTRNTVFCQHLHYIVSTITIFQSCCFLFISEIHPFNHPCIRICHSVLFLVASHYPF